MATDAAVTSYLPIVSLHELRMSSSPQPVESSRSIPLQAFLCLMAGSGIYFSAPRIAWVIRAYSDEIESTGNVLGGGLVLWGVKLTLERWLQKPGQTVGRLNRNKVMLPKEGMAYLVIMIVTFIGAIFGRQNMLMLVFSIMAGPFIVNGGVAFSQLKRNRVRRTQPARAMAGEVISVDITFENRKFWIASWMMQVRDRVGHESHVNAGKHDVILSPAVLFARVPARSERSTRYQLRVTKRGRYVFGPLEVATRFPLGLVERGFIETEFSEMLVHPQIGTLAPSWYREYQLANNFVERQDTHHGTFEDEFHHLRDYRNGDNPRDIHWRTSARVNDLMVRQFHQSRDRGLSVILDLYLPARPSAANVDTIELALSFVATICLDHTRRTRGVEQSIYIAGNKSARWRTNRGSLGLDPLFDLLAQIEGGDAREITQLIEEASQQNDSATRFVLVTTRPRGVLPVDVDKLSVLPGIEILHANVKDLERYFSLESSFVGELTPIKAETELKESELSATR